MAVALVDARAIYLEQGPDAARDPFERIFARLLTEEPASAAVRNEASILLGEIQYLQGEEASARSTFRWLLERDPEATISPYTHPLDVIGIFEIVRRTVQTPSTTTVPTLPPPRPAPAWTLLPFGTPQFGEKRHAAGLALGVGQAALATASIGSFIWLNKNNVGPQHPRGWTPEQVRSRVSTARWGVQVPSTAGFYGLWVASAIVARAEWRRDSAAKLSVSPGGVGLTVRLDKQPAARR